MNKEKIGILTIATNKYVEYWFDLLESWEKIESNQEIVFHVFTDDVNYIKNEIVRFRNLTIEIHEIPAYKWPEASLYRYRIFNKFASEISEPILMHLDADMRIMSDFSKKIPKVFLNGIALVRHPGYFRPSGLKKILFYLCSPRHLIIDIKTNVLIGGLGSWERNSYSTAYVPRSERKVYICGGTWLGDRDSFLRMVADLSTNEQTDSKNSYIASWHDESHLNWWNANNLCTILDPSFCFDPNYSQLKGLPEFIRAINKNDFPK